MVRLRLISEFIKSGLIITPGINKSDWPIMIPTDPILWPKKTFIGTVATAINAPAIKGNRSIPNPLNAIEYALPYAYKTVQVAIAKTSGRLSIYLPVHQKIKGRYSTTNSRLANPTPTTLNRTIRLTVDLAHLQSPFAFACVRADHIGVIVAKCIDINTRKSLWIRLKSPASSKPNTWLTM